jgi:hypothetical protein
VDLCKKAATQVWSGWWFVDSGPIMKSDLSGKPGVDNKSPVDLFLTHVNVGKSIWMTCVGVSRKASG